MAIINFSYKRSFSLNDLKRAADTISSRHSEVDELREAGETLLEVIDDMRSEIDHTKDTLSDAQYLSDKLRRAIPRALLFEPTETLLDAAAQINDWANEQDIPIDVLNHHDGILVIFYKDEDMTLAKVRFAHWTIIK